VSVISCSNLVVGYKNKHIVENLTFDINNGDFLCIVGENGAGKSTLVRTLVGLIPAISGNINYSIPKNRIGYLPQQTAAQSDFPASVYEIVLSGCLNSCGPVPFFSVAQKQKAVCNMEKLGISDLSSECFRELSGGQQQRVLLARALCASSELIILDEPVTGLDPLVTKDMYRIISDINSSGTTVVMISHDINSSVKYASHILHIAGKPRFFGTVTDYINSDAYTALISGRRYHGR